MSSDIQRLQFVLSGFPPYLASYFGRSLSKYSYGYTFSNDQPNYFANYGGNSGSFMNYPG